MCVTHNAVEVALHQPLDIQLSLEAAHERHEVMHGQCLHDGLVLLDDGPGAVLQDQEAHIPEGRGRRDG